MLFSSFLAVTLTPVLMTLFIMKRRRSLAECRIKISLHGLSEDRHPVSILLHKIYEPVVMLR